MPKEILTARAATGETVRFLLDVEQAGDHWTSTLARLGPDGTPESSQVAPRFYGLTAEQARRRMLQVLEADYDDIESRPA